MKMAVAFFLLLSGCASKDLLRRADYTPSQTELRRDQPQLALAAFPKSKERGGFLTTVELGYLNLLNGTPDPMPLVKISDQLAKREVIRVSKELGYFFFQEAEDGYLPAEHEVIWLHLVAGYSFAANGNREGARVEAERAAHLLQGHYEERTGDFDDESLRLLLAGLWLYCDEWEHARVDLRRAYEMNSELRWAKIAAEKSKPPKGFAIVLAGAGPEPEWLPDSMEAKLTSINSLHFPAVHHYDEIRLAGADLKPRYLKPDLSTARWYERHQRRNTEIRDAVTGSRYLAKAAGQSVYTGSGVALTKVLAGTFATIGLAFAAAIVVGAVYLATQLGSSSASDMIAYGFMGGASVAAYTVKESSNFNRTSMTSLKKDWTESMDPSPNYRFMRFLPDQTFSGLTANEPLNLWRDTGGDIPPFLALKSAKHGTTVQLFFIPR